VTSLPREFPPLDMTPGPPLAEPLPADRPVRWGILATGKIARLFADDLMLLPDAQLAAVGSRSKESAEAFAAAYDVPRAYDSYEGLVADPDVDVVYVATPHALHAQDVALAFDAGKAVLCEKPLTLSVTQAEPLVARARAERLFFMEGMWTRCIPAVRRLPQLLATGAYGEVRQVRADFGFAVQAPPEHRLLNPALGGGALLDIGIYPLTYARLFMGAPETVTVAANLAPTGIDLDIVIGLVDRAGAVAALTASITAVGSQSASVATDRGRFDVHPPFHHPDTVTWRSGDVSETFTEPRIGSGLAHEAIEVMRCLRSGETESPLVPLDETLAVMRLMDELRGQIGVVYEENRIAESGTTRTAPRSR
jgi:predicted dehydrogenase